MTWLLRCMFGLATLLALGAGAILVLDRMPAAESSVPPGSLTQTAQATPETLARGSLLARAGNCQACHTARGGAGFAGGRAITTPFGTVYSSNLTPDEATGLGLWTPDDFWRAMHQGRAPDGRRLLPAFPYTEFTRMSRADSDALYAWLRTVPPVAQARRSHELRGLYGHPLALAAWRVLFFEPTSWRSDAARSAEWNQGAYLVQVVAHCGACHAGRNAWGAARGDGLSGGLMPSRHWYAPALDRPDEAGVSDWPLEEIVGLLRDGVAPRGRVSGPMAEVVLHGTQHLPAADLRAMATYLKSLPVSPTRSVQAHAPLSATGTPDPARTAAGEKLYGDHCADCHGPRGDGGVTPDGRPAVPALAGNRLVTMDPAVNLVRAVALGGFAPATAGHPRPFGMPPYAHVLSDEDIARVLTYLRSAWGHQAAPLTAFDVARWRGATGD